MMGLLVLMTVADVVLRFFFNNPILGSFELTEYLLVPITCFAIAWASHEKANVRVDLIVGKWSRRPKAILYAASCFLSLIMAFIFAWFTVPQAFYILDINIVSDMLKIPAYPFYFIIALGFFILFFILISSLIEFIEEAVAK